MRNEPRSAKIESIRKTRCVSHEQVDGGRGGGEGRRGTRREGKGRKGGGGAVAGNRLERKGKGRAMGIPSPETCIGGADFLEIERRTLNEKLVIDTNTLVR